MAPGVESVAAGRARWWWPTRPPAASASTAGEDGRESLCDDLLFWNGAYAEFARIPARVVRKNLLPLEPGVGFREAAMVEPLACVVRGIEAEPDPAGPDPWR